MTTDIDDFKQKCESILTRLFDSEIRPSKKQIDEMIWRNVSFFVDTVKLHRSKEVFAGFLMELPSIFTWVPETISFPGLAHNKVVFSIKSIETGKFYVAEVIFSSDHKITFFQIQESVTRNLSVGWGLFILALVFGATHNLFMRIV